MVGCDSWKDIQTDKSVGDSGRSRRMEEEKEVIWAKREGKICWGPSRFWLLGKKVKNGWVVFCGASVAVLLLLWLDYGSGVDCVGRSQIQPQTDFWEDCMLYSGYPWNYNVARVFTLKTQSVNVEQGKSCDRFSKGTVGGQNSKTFVKSYWNWNFSYVI